VSPEQIEETHVSTLRQISLEVPSLVIQGFNPRNATVTIRGLGAVAGVSGLEQGVGVYVDGVYQARPAITVFGLWDLSGVEVLRGPQGTLNGKNTTAGAINITTIAPSFTPESTIETSVGNYSYSQVRGIVNGRIGDSDFALRLSGDLTNRTGNIFDTTNNAKWNDFHSFAPKAQLLYAPNDDFTVRVIADYNAQKEEAGIYVAEAVLPTTLGNGSTVLGYYQKAARFPTYQPIVPDPAARFTDTGTDSTIVMNTGGFSTQVDAKIEGGNTLTSITAFRWWNWNPSIDGDSIGLPISTKGNLATMQRQVSQELRIASPPGALGGLFDYTAGLYYFWQNGTEYQDSAYGTAAGGWYLSPIGGVVAPASTLNGLASLANVYSTTNSLASYASGTYHIIPNLNLTLGVRYTYEAKVGEYNEWASDPVPISSLPTVWQAPSATERAALAPTASYAINTESGRPTGNAILSYRINDQALVYTSFSRGFKGAGLNLVTPTAGVSHTVGPETIDAYELGAKTNFFDNRLTLNTDLFLENDFDYQAQEQTVVSGRAINYVGNIPKVRTEGVEVSARALIYEGLTAKFSATYDNAFYASFGNAQCPYVYSYYGSCNLTGSPLFGVSRFSLFGGVEYQHQMGSIEPHELGFYKLNGQQVIGFIGGDVTYRSSFYGQLNDDPYTRVPPYTLFYLHAGARTEDGRLSLLFWVRNLLNKTYFDQITVTNNSATSIGLANAVLGEPRYFGMTLAAKF